MTIDRNLLDKIRSRGEEVLTQLSADLMSNPGFVKAMEGAVRGREKIEQAAAAALKQMNVPSRGELKRATSRIDALEKEIAELRGRVRAGRAAAKPAARTKAAPRRGAAAGRKVPPGRPAAGAKAGSE
jgi:hypothetical protein